MSSKFEVKASAHFVNWLKEQNSSITFSTYQAGKLFMIGVNKNESLSVSERTFNRCMGLSLTDNGFWMSSLFQMWKFENSLLPGQFYKGYDRIYIPQKAYTTGKIDIHDIVVDDDQPYFINTLFNCIATISDNHSFKPVWKPNFISKLVPEDRCHLNGLALKEGKAKYVTVVGKSNIKDGWRSLRQDGGFIIDIENDQIVCSNLSMPHSPRYYKGKLWLLNSGTGFFGYVDDKTGEFEPVTFCPGFLRGLDFVGDYAIVGTSEARENKTFSELELDSQLSIRGIEPTCALHIIDLRTGEIVHWLALQGVVKELYDVKIINGVKCPLIVGTQSDQIEKMITIESN